MGSEASSREQQLQQVLELSKKVLSTIDLPELLDNILQALVTFSAAETGMIVFVKDKKVMYGPSISSGDTPGFGDSGQRASRTAIEYVLKTGRVLMTGSADHDARLASKETVTEAGIKSILAIPLRHKDDTVGAVYLQDTNRNDAFESVHLDILQSLSAYAALAIQNARLYAETIRDPLTQLYSSRYFESCVEREVDKHLRENHPLSVLFIDVDKLKHVNDEYGHDVGDLVLKKVGEVMRSAVRMHDLVGRGARIDSSLAARFGGDEFQIMLTRTDKAEAAAVANRIVEQMREATFKTEKVDDLKVTLSVGVATIPQDAKTFTDLRREADKAMYKAKRQGRDGVVVTGDLPKTEEA